MQLSKISVIITSFNEAINIRRCLANLDGFGEIILVDSFSEDGTLEVAREFPVTIYQRPYVSAAMQKNWALGRVCLPWVLILDADEALSESLKRELQELDEANARRGYWIRRRSEYLGRPIRHCGWQRDKVLRLFRREAGRYEERHVHEEIQLNGSAGILQYELQHFPYARVEAHLKKIQEYSTRGARDYLERGGRFALFNMLLHPPMRFFRMYVFQGGILDGSRGFVLCLLSSYGVFIKYAKAWETSHCRSLTV